ncbi:MAG: glutamyl-tRNA reductase [Acidobacteria bacterium]|nr:MAG: glutamyl-tRNA reductase [Acidobacteriota bacterium]
MSLLVVGLNHRTAPIELREHVAFAPAQAREAIQQLTREGVLEEAVIVSTCNRSEVYGVSALERKAVPAVQSFVCQFHRVDPQRLNGAFYHYLEADAVRHLFRVAASLDSMVLGEPHILGQVRQAFSMALECRTTGLILNHLFQKAAQVGKRVRSETEIGLRPTSVSAVAVELATKIFGELGDRSVLVVGAGQMSQLTARGLAMRGAGRITVTNRSFDRATVLAEQVGGRALPWEQLVTSLKIQDIVITSVQTDQYIIRRDVIEQMMSERNHRPLFLIDLGLPRNIDPDAEHVYNVFLYNLDDLQSIAARNREAREKDIPKAERIVEEEVRKFMRWQESLSAVSTIKSLRFKAERIRQSELEAHLRRLGPLSDRQRNIITALTLAIVNKILHEPTVRLKQSADKRHLESIRYLFDLDDEE